MNKIYNKVANREGFTLVELIVVIAILGILAGIAIPVYSGYIKKANEAALYQELDAIKTAAVFAYTEDHVNDNPIPEVETIVVTASDITVQGDSYKADATFLDLVNQTTSFAFDFGNTGKTTATWNKTATATDPAGWTLS